MEYESLNAFFAVLKDQEYLVLRNYEDFYTENFLTDHPDVDLLCTDVKAMVRALDAYPKGAREDGLHYAVTIAGKKVPVDMRTVGDGYFDKIWQRETLNKRILLDSFYCMDTENYFYTLLYHACVHKGTISPDYVKKLDRMARQLGISFSQEKSIEILEMYMRKYGYSFTYPRSITTPAHLDKVDKHMIRFSFIHLYRDVKVQINKMIKSMLGRA